MTINSAILILAAGESCRLGTPKQLLQINGETLIRRIACRASASSAAEVLVVLGHQREAIQNELRDLDKVRAIPNPDYALGMGTSIRRGVEALKTCDIILISVCDQPHLTVDIFDRLIARLPDSRNGIVASRYSQTLGVPAIFAREHFPQLLSLPDDLGARNLIKGLEADEIEFPFGDIDIDTIDDLKTLLRAH